MRRWVFQLHLWLALTAGSFFVVLGVTGSIIAFEPQLDHLRHPMLSYVRSSPHDLPLEDILGFVRRAYPGQDIVAVSFSDSPGLALQVTIPGGIVCVDPHTGRVLGIRGRGETLLGLARDLHVSLAAGSIGRTAIRWFDVAALILLVSGLTLWWPQRSLRLRRLDRSRRSWSDLHNSIGILSLLFLFVAAATGAVISFESSLRTLFRRSTGNEAVQASPVTPPREGTPWMSPDRALAVASAALPGSDVMQMEMPEYGGTYRFQMVEHHLFSANTERDISLDPWSGTVLEIQQGAPSTSADRMLATNEALHTGAILGWPGRAIMAMASLLLVPQAFSGLVMFLKRTRHATNWRKQRLEKGSTL